MINKQQTTDLGTILNLIELLVQPGPGPCVSIVVTMHKELNQRTQNATLIQHAVKKAHTALDAFSCPTTTRQLVAQRVDALVEELNIDEPQDAIGLFISPQVSTLISFPFSVNEIILVGNSFETRDILYLKQHLAPYYIVSLGKNSVRLFEAHADSLQELRDGGFPFQFEDDYEYSRSTVASSVGSGKKGFEKDKGIMSEMRGESFVRDAADHLTRHIGGASAELIVCGPPRLANEFAEVCSGKDRTVVKVAGAHGAGEFSGLIEKAWPACQASRKEKIQKMITDLDDLGPNYKAIGIRDVWDAATNGNGLRLLVERDYQCPGYRQDGASKIRLHPPTGNFETVADAVDDVIEKVLMAGGKVVFTETNQLRKFEQVGMMLRHK